MADLIQQLNENDYKHVAVASGNIGNNPKRTEIEAILTDNNIAIPTEDVTFFLIDSNNHNMQVTYIKSLDGYFYTSMTLAT